MIAAVLSAMSDIWKRWSLTTDFMVAFKKGENRMYGKLKITAEIHVLTGLHIGGNNTPAAIGAVDSPVVRDARTHLPMIPGSTLKGKLRI